MMKRNPGLDHFGMIAETGRWVIKYIYFEFQAIILITIIKRISETLKILKFYIDSDLSRNLCLEITDQFTISSDYSWSTYENRSFH